MSKVLYIKASPRRERSKSAKAAEAFINAYRLKNPVDGVDVLDVFTEDLPAFDGPALEVKYAILTGRDATDEQKEAWKAVEAVIERFALADKYVLAVPMWNFSIPYRLKQYLDLLIQPTYTFSFSPEEGYSGLLKGKKAMVVYASGGQYDDPQAAGLDFQKPYLELILAFMGITDVSAVSIQPTLMGGPDVAAEKLAVATRQLEDLAQEF